MQEKVTSYADVGRWHSWLSAQESETLAISETVLLSAGGAPKLHAYLEDSPTLCLGGRCSTSLYARTLCAQLRN
jgi:hypothetical protein